MKVRSLHDERVDRVGCHIEEGFASEPDIASTEEILPERELCSVAEEDLCSVVERETQHFVGGRIGYRMPFEAFGVEFEPDDKQSDGQQGGDGRCGIDPSAQAADVSALCDFGVEFPRGTLDLETSGVAVDILQGTQLLQPQIFGAVFVASSNPGTHFDGRVGVAAAVDEFQDLRRAHILLFLHGSTD